MLDRKILMKCISQIVFLAVSALEKLQELLYFLNGFKADFHGKLDSKILLSLI